MRKNFKLILIVSSVIIILIVLFLIIKSQIKFKGNELVCTRPIPGIEDKEQITVQFDEEGKPINYIETQIIVFSSNKEAKEFLDKFKEDSSEETGETVEVFYDSKTELLDNEIHTSFYYKIEETDKRYNKTKEELIKYYEQEYMYNCEV